MPLIQVDAPQGDLDKSQQDALMSQLSNAVLKAEGAPLESAGAQSLVWAHFNEKPQGTFYVGGTALEKPPFRIAVTTPQGALTDDTRATLVAEIGRIVDDIVGAYDIRLNHWAMLYEVTEGGWAGAGQIFRLGDIQKAMDIVAA
ncbi:MAG: phenylpyruvate tautomerase PptA (4-oxalocrotonate tautomerase family) [Ascidiaceihabitans sp.]